MTFTYRYLWKNSHGKFANNKATERIVATLVKELADEPSNSTFSLEFLWDKMNHSSRPPLVQAGVKMVKTYGPQKKRKESDHGNN